MTARSRGTRAAPAIEIVVESRLWSAQRNARAVIRRAIGAAAAMAPTGKGEIAIVLTDDPAMRRLNRAWRGKNAPTNVLSFPASKDNGAAHLGDIAIAYETTAREAKAEHKHFRHHLAHLAVHGYLHLAGYDHIDEQEAQIMENLEIAVLQRLKVPNPYVARDAKG
jgi:probable rRNA maturation factor